MTELKKCPFCGNNMNMHGIRFKKDNRLILGVQHVICTIECLGCTASIQQAGVDKDDAKKNATEVWNRRADT